jgi:hypothetical protein
LGSKGGKANFLCNKNLGGDKEVPIPINGVVIASNG